MVTLSLFLFLIEITSVSATDGIYYVSETSSTWTGKDTVCSVAIPPINYTSAGITTYIDNSIIDNEDVWVGYYQIRNSFEYIGCLTVISVRRLGIILSETSNVGNPGLCFSACSYGTIIGLLNSKCFCLKGDREITSLRSNFTNCTAECDLQPEVQCGGSEMNGSSFISVYRSVPEVLRHTENRGTDVFCLQLDSIKNSFIWNYCSTKLNVVCDFGDDKYVAIASPGINGSWISNANMCFIHGGFPIRFQNYSGTGLVSRLTTSMWTNVILSDVISSGHQNNKEKPFCRGRITTLHGFVRKQGNSYMLDFTDINSENTLVYKRVLCYFGNGQKENTLSGSSVIVGVCSAVVLVIATIVFLFAALKRRQLMATLRRYQKNNKTTDSDQPNDTLPNAAGRSEVDNNAYDTTGDIDHQTGTSHTVSNQMNDNEKVHTNFVLKKHEKEHMESTSYGKIIGAENSTEHCTNVYNKLNPEVEYDHLFKAKQTVGQTSDNNYNTSVYKNIGPSKTF